MSAGVYDASFTALPHSGDSQSEPEATRQLSEPLLLELVSWLATHARGVAALRLESVIT
jgi:hypothetical protein